MSQLLQRPSPSLYADGTEAPQYAKGGLPYTRSSALAVASTGAIDHYHQGLPFTVEGRLAVSLAGTPVRWGGGSAPFDAAGRLVIGAGAADHYSAGVGYTATSSVEMTVDPTSVDYLLLEDGFFLLQEDGSKIILESSP